MTEHADIRFGDGSSADTLVAFEVPDVPCGPFHLGVDPNDEKNHARRPVKHFWGRLLVQLLFKNPFLSTEA